MPAGTIDDAFDFIEYRICQCQMSMCWMRRKRLDLIRKYISESVNHFSGETIRIKVEYEPNQVTNAILYDFAGENVNKVLAPESLKTSVINELKSAVKHYK